MIQAVIYVEVFKIISLLNKRTLADRQPPPQHLMENVCLPQFVCFVLSLSFFKVVSIYYHWCNHSFFDVFIL